MRILYVKREEWAGFTTCIYDTQCAWNGSYLFIINSYYYYVNRLSIIELNFKKEMVDLNLRVY